ncbi:DUF1133 family protein [Escherichia coli]|nr:DUF1133 family protein [Escherichia coli]
MIYPTNTGKSGNTFVSPRWKVSGFRKTAHVGRWSYIGGGKTGNMFNQLLTSKKLTKTAINEALRRMKKQVWTNLNLRLFAGYDQRQAKSWLVHCADAEALCIDRVISEVLAEHPGLICILRQRYEGRG